MLHTARERDAGGQAHSLPTAQREEKREGDEPRKARKKRVDTERERERGERIELFSPIIPRAKLTMKRRVERV